MFTNAFVTSKVKVIETWRSRRIHFLSVAFMLLRKFKLPWRYSGWECIDSIFRCIKFSSYMHFLALVSRPIVLISFSGDCLILMQTDTWNNSTQSQASQQGHRGNAQDTWLRWPLSLQLASQIGNIFFSFCFARHGLY